MHQGSDVSIVIYDITGNQIRKFEIGYCSAGQYITPQRALYWDGKNNLGEQVSSGIYICKLKVGDFSTQRKIQMMK